MFEPGIIQPCDKRKILLADNSSVTATQSGEVIIPFVEVNIRLKNVLLTPTLEYNLVSTGRLAENGIELHSRRFDILLKLKTTGAEIGCGNRYETSGMYTLPLVDRQKAL